MTSVFNFSKNYNRYRWYITKRNSKGGYRRVKNLPVYETREAAEKALSQYDDTNKNQYYINRDFVR
jgi:uncharacterized protein YijF (DUF1287 family)